MTTTHLNEIKSTPARRKAGNVVFVVSICLTAYFASSAMRQTRQGNIRQQLMYAIAESGSYPLAVVDSTGHVVIWNDAMKTLTGKNMDKINSEGLESIMCDASKRRSHRDSMMSALADPVLLNKSLIIHCEIYNASKKKIPVTVYLHEIRLTGGELFAVARIEAESKIVELGTPSDERMRANRIDEIDKGQKAKAAE